jgi:hypothetical protein
MSPSKEVDISKSLDTAETRRVSGDPIVRKLRTTLQDGKEKYNGSKKMAVQVLAALTRIGECLMEVSPTIRRGMERTNEVHDGYGPGRPRA